MPNFILTEPNRQPTMDTDVLIIGAGPAGSVAAQMLNRLGHKVVILESQQFPRFSIGESLLPQCMAFLEAADMLDAVGAENFQFKNGAAFSHAGKLTEFDFRQKFTPGWGTTFQVPRGRFDQVLADTAERSGATVHYRHKIVGAAVLASLGMVGWGVQRVEYLYKLETRVQILELTTNSQNIERSMEAPRTQGPK